MNEWGKRKNWKRRTKITYSEKKKETETIYSGWNMKEKWINDETERTERERNNLFIKNR